VDQSLWIFRPNLKILQAHHLAVKQPMKFELITNLKVSKRIGLTIPQKILARADRFRDK
jgi:ABC-type uncharacterized transport system substrate-binding protein